MKFKPRHRTRPKGEAPLLIQRGLVNDEIEVRERAVINAFEYGYATTEHFDILADMQGLLLLAGTTSEARKPAMLYAHNVLGPVLQSIRARYNRTKKLGCNTAELKVLREFVSMYRDFWLRQPGELLTAARTELSRHNAKIATKRKQEIHEMILRAPCTVEDVAKEFNLQPSAIQTFLESLQASGKASSTPISGSSDYLWSGL